MQFINHLVCSTIPDSLARVPVPTTLKGFSRLSFRDWLSLITFSGVSGFLGYSVYHTVKDMYFRVKCNCHPVNPNIRKNESKVVNTYNMDEMADKTVLCRCWRSSKFPMCDGSHVKHNQLTGDNVGPLVINKKA